MTEPAARDRSAVQPAGLDEFLRTGWLRFPRDDALDAWVAAARPAALDAVRDPANTPWMRCEGTWFAGVNVLANRPDGAVRGSGPLAGRMAEFAAALPGIGGFRWDRAQVSVVYPGYPRPKEGEGPAAFRFRRDRDAAHVDGLVAIGPERRRYLREPHAFIAGIPLTETDPGASPFVVWEGSHEVMRAALGAVLRAHPPEVWPDADLTEAYKAARLRIFETCRRVEVHARPGEAYLIHRLALHGIAPWRDGAVAPTEGRVVVYFRPELDGPVTGWVGRP